MAAGYQVPGACGFTTTGYLQLYDEPQEPSSRHLAPITSTRRQLHESAAYSRRWLPAP